MTSSFYIKQNLCCLSFWFRAEETFCCLLLPHRGASGQQKQKKINLESGNAERGTDLSDKLGNGDSYQRLALLSLSGSGV